MGKDRSMQKTRRRHSLMATFSESAPEQAGETLTAMQANEVEVEINSVL
jgi:hypothetical protein